MVGLSHMNLTLHDQKSYPYYPTWNQTASSVGWSHPVVGKAKGLEFGIARTPFHDMYQQCPGNANGKVWGDEMRLCTKKGWGERMWHDFFLSLFVADSRTVFVFWNRYGIERGRNHQASKPWVSNHPKMSFRCPYRMKFRGQFTQFPPKKLTSLKWKSPSFLVYTIKMADFSWWC